MSTAITVKAQPKRVILRLRVEEFDGRDPSEYNDAIKAYLAFAQRPTSELEENKHYAHIEPFQAADIPQTAFHITLDMDKDSIQAPNFEILPHEAYRIRRDEQGNLCVKRIANALEERNYLTKIRQFTDSLYAWAK